MDPFSITAACVSLLDTVLSASTGAITFIRECREARSEAQAVSGELHVLTTVLDVLKDEKLPATLEPSIHSILKDCNVIVSDIVKLLKKHSGASRADRAARWALNGRGEVNKLRSTLEAHRSALNLALEVAAISMLRDTRADVQEGNDANRLAHAATQHDTRQILTEIERLRKLLVATHGSDQQAPRDANGSSATPTQPNFVLERYLDSLTNYAASEYNFEPGHSSPSLAETITEEPNADGDAPTTPDSGECRYVRVSSVATRKNG
jgi:hypothetical protein